VIIEGADDRRRKKNRPVPTETLRPHCPKCRGKPQQGQRKLAETERDRLAGPAFGAVSARFATAYVCKSCDAIYSHQDGFSTYIARLRKA
jgi:hypothetical protein